MKAALAKKYIQETMKEIKDLFSVSGNGQLYSEAMAAMAEVRKAEQQKRARAAVRKKAFWKQAREFAATGLGPKMKQIILHEATIPLPLDLETPDVQEWVRKKAFAALATARAPVVCSVLALNADRFVLALLVHHYLADGWSAGVICHDFE